MSGIEFSDEVKKYETGKFLRIQWNDIKGLESRYDTNWDSVKILKQQLQLQQPSPPQSQLQDITIQQQQ